MFKIMSLGAVVGAGLLLQGCAGVSSLEGQDMASVPSKTFNASKERVVQATEKSFDALGYNFKNTKAGEPTSEVYFSKPMSAFSWGEVGRIDVTRIGADSAKVAIGTEKRFQLQVTGTSQDEFSRKIFTEIEKNLSR